MVEEIGRFDIAMHNLVLMAPLERLTETVKVRTIVGQRHRVNIRPKLVMLVVREDGNHIVLMPKNVNQPRHIVFSPV